MTTVTSGKSGRNLVVDHLEGSVATSGSLLGVTLRVTETVRCAPENRMGRRLR